MLLQNSQIGKTAVIFITLLILAGLATMPLFLQADSTGEATPEASLFLPAIYKDANSTPEPVSTATPTQTSTSTITPSPIVTSTSAPLSPFIQTSPQCTSGSSVTLQVSGFNWPTDEDIFVFFDGSSRYFHPAPHSGSFTTSWLESGLTTNTYTILAQSTGSNTDSETLEVPCATPPTSTPTPIPETPTPAPADLIIGQPALISTPPITAYEPVTFQVSITNTGNVDIKNLFFVDLLFDPPPTHFSDVYTAVSGLGGSNSTTLTITSPIGFAIFLDTHQVTGWVDSLDHVAEADETNNLSDPLEVTGVTPASTPTVTPTLSGTETISGIARIFLGGSFIPQERIAISVLDEATGIIIAVTYSDENGFYQFNNVPLGTFTVQGCIVIDNDEYFGIRSGRTPPDQFADIFALEGACP